MLKQRYTGENKEEKREKRKKEERRTRSGKMKKRSGKGAKRASGVKEQFFLGGIYLTCYSFLGQNIRTLGNCLLCLLQYLLFYSSVNYPLKIHMYWQLRFCHSREYSITRITGMIYWPALSLVSRLPLLLIECNTVLYLFLILIFLYIKLAPKSRVDV